MIGSELAGLLRPTALGYTPRPFLGSHASTRNTKICCLCPWVMREQRCFRMWGQIDRVRRTRCHRTGPGGCGACGRRCPRPPAGAPRTRSAPRRRRALGPAPAQSGTVRPAAANWSASTCPAEINNTALPLEHAAACRGEESRRASPKLRLSGKACPGLGGLGRGSRHSGLHSHPRNAQPMYLDLAGYSRGRAAHPARLQAVTHTAVAWYQNSARTHESQRSGAPHLVTP